MFLLLLRTSALQSLCEVLYCNSVVMLF